MAPEEGKFEEQQIQSRCLRQFKCGYERPNYPSVCLPQPLSGVNLVGGGPRGACEDASGKSLPTHTARERTSVKTPASREGTQVLGKLVEDER